MIYILYLDKDGASLGSFMDDEEAEAIVEILNAGFRIVDEGYVLERINTELEDEKIAFVIKGVSCSLGLIPEKE